VADIKPIFLLADSQLLFWTDEEGRRFMDRARTLIEEDAAGRAPRAAYLGASNGDAPEFYDLFVSAMGEIGIRECRHVPAQPSAEDLQFLDGADLILLAGGDVWLGWNAFETTGVKDRIVQRYYAGAVLVGVSAGAVQLGLNGWDEEDSTIFDTLRLVPFVVDVHDEPQWPRLTEIVPRLGEHGRGFGIPAGGGALYHSDYSVEPVRHPLTEVEVTGTSLRQSMLLPGQSAEIEDAGERPRVVSQEELVENVLRELGADPDTDEPVN
jgi:peptidase E